MSELKLYAVFFEGEFFDGIQGAYRGINGKGVYTSKQYAKAFITKSVNAICSSEYLLEELGLNIEEYSTKGISYKDSKKIQRRKDRLRNKFSIKEFTEEE